MFLTNHHGLGASTIAAIYKDRWQIELFFKALKQNLKIKTFVGTSANAVKTQIWTALICDAAAALLATVLPLRLEHGESGGTAAHESVYPPRSDGLARRTIHRAARSDRTTPRRPWHSPDLGQHHGGTIPKLARNPSAHRVRSARHPPDSPSWTAVLASQQACVAVARELAGFVWAIGMQAQREKAEAT